MLKFVAVLVLSVVLVQGRPSSGFFNDDIEKALAAGNWEEIQKILRSSIVPHGNWEFRNHRSDCNGTFVKYAGFARAIPATNVKSLKPIPGGHVYGESEYTFHSETNVNGQTSEKSAGHKIVNDDGHISEFDFKPVVKPAIRP